MPVVGSEIERRDADIRTALETWLLDKEHGTFVRLIHEFSIPRPSSRIDLALINGRISGYEIKSDVDSLTRLASQMNSYGKFFEHLAFVTTPKKSKLLLEKTPDWCGVISLTNSGRFRTLRKMKLNPNIDSKCLLYSLNKKELSTNAKTLFFDDFKSSLNKENIIEIFLKGLSKKYIIKMCRETIKNR